MRILFEHEHLYYLPQFEPIIHDLQKRGETDIYCSISESVPNIEKKLFKKEMVRLDVGMVQGNFEPQRQRIIKDMNFDVIFVGNKTSLSSIKSRNSFAVMVYHGIGLKKSYYTDLSSEMDMICVESKSREIQLSNMGFPATTTGFTKLDPIAEKLNSDEKDKEKTTLLYAPTFFPSSLQKTMPFIQQLDQYDLRIKLHHFYWTNPKYRPIREALVMQIAHYNHVSLLGFDSYNIIDHFIDADVLISDLSSVLFEFLPFNRPVIQTHYYSLRMKYKLFPHLLKKRLDSERLKSVNFTTNCNAPENLLDILNQVTASPNENSNERQSACKQFLGKIDGKASERVINALINSGIPIGQGD